MGYLWTTRNVFLCSEIALCAFGASVSLGQNNVVDDRSEILCLQQISDNTYDAASDISLIYGELSYALGSSDNSLVSLLQAIRRYTGNSETDIASIYQTVGDRAQTAAGSYLTISQMMYDLWRFFHKSSYNDSTGQSQAPFFTQFLDDTLADLDDISASLAELKRGDHGNRTLADDVHDLLEHTTNYLASIQAGQERIAIGAEGSATMATNILLSVGTPNIWFTGSGYGEMYNELLNMYYDRELLESWFTLYSRYPQIYLQNFGNIPSPRVLQGIYNLHNPGSAPLADWQNFTGFKSWFSDALEYQGGVDYVDGAHSMGDVNYALYGTANILHELRTITNQFQQMNGKYVTPSAEQVQAVQVDLNIPGGNLPPTEFTLINTNFDYLANIDTNIVGFFDSSYSRIHVGFAGEMSQAARGSRFDILDGAPAPFVFEVNPDFSAVLPSVDAGVSSVASASVSSDVYARFEIEPDENLVEMFHKVLKWAFALTKVFFACGLVKMYLDRIRN